MIDIRRPLRLIMLGSATRAVARPGLKTKNQSAMRTRTFRQAGLRLVALGPRRQVASAPEFQASQVAAVRSQPPATPAH